MIFVPPCSLFYVFAHLLQTFFPILSHSLFYKNARQVNAKSDNEVQVKIETNKDLIDVDP